jgi:hypothetical protein
VIQHAPADVPADELLDDIQNASFSNISAEEIRKVEEFNSLRTFIMGQAHYIYHLADIGDLQTATHRLGLMQRAVGNESLKQLTRYTESENIGALAQACRHIADGLAG